MLTVAIDEDSFVTRFSGASQKKWCESNIDSHANQRVRHTYTKSATLTISRFPKQAILLQLVLIAVVTPSLQLSQQQDR